MVRNSWVCVCVYLHLLVHFYIDGFDFVQLLSQSDQCVLVIKSKRCQSCCGPVLAEIKTTCSNTWHKCSYDNDADVIPRSDSFMSFLMMPPWQLLSLRTPAGGVCVAESGLTLAELPKRRAPEDLGFISIVTRIILLKCWCVNTSKMWCPRHEQCHF